MSMEKKLHIMWSSKTTISIFLSSLIALSILSSAMVLLCDLIVREFENTLTETAQFFVVMFMYSSLAFVYFFCLSKFLARHKLSMEAAVQKKHASTILDILMMVVWIFGVPILSILINALAQRIFSLPKVGFEMQSVFLLALTFLTLFPLLSFLESKE